MNVPVWVGATAEQFWKETDEVASFPRNLRSTIAMNLPLGLVDIPELTTGEVRDWLQSQGIACGLRERRRRLRACLMIERQSGFIFLDKNDNPQEQLFSLAHELAHYLRDYRHPRCKAVEALGPRVLEVLDGKRPPTADERLSAVLRGVSIGFHVHLMERDARGRANRLVQQVETDADRLAYELLTPVVEVRSRLEPTADARKCVELLCACFGLPEESANRYAAILYPPVRRDPFLKALFS